MMKLKNEVAPSPSDTTIPGLSQRRVWKAPDVTSHSLVVLTLPRLYLTPMTGEPKTEVIGQLQTVRMVDAFLGPLATAIDLHAVRADIARHDRGRPRVAFRVLPQNLTGHLEGKPVFHPLLVPAAALHKTKSLFHGWFLPE